MKHSLFGILYQLSAEQGPLSLQQCFDLFEYLLWLRNALAISPTYLLSSVINCFRLGGAKYSLYNSIVLCLNKCRNWFQISKPYGEHCRTEWKLTTFIRFRCFPFQKQNKRLICMACAVTSISSKLDRLSRRSLLIWTRLSDLMRILAETKAWRDRTPM